MASKHVGAHPSEVIVIRDVTPNIVTCSLPFSRFGLFKVGGRGTIVRLASGALAVFSPVALTPEITTKLQSLGNNVKYVAALDIEHHIFLSDWHSAFPSAHFIAPEGLAEKRAKAAKSNQKMTNVPFSTIFTKRDKSTIKVSEEFDNDFEYEYVDAHRNKEIVFFHKPDRALIEADLMFNLPATEQYSRTGETVNSGFFTKLFGSIQSTQGTAIWQKRMLWYALSMSDRTGFNTSVRKIDSWEFDTVIPCHGDVIQGDGKGIFQKVFQWHLQGQNS
jgi:hypothetical protein